MTDNKRVLIVVDAQNSFCEGGSLASVGAANTCTNIAEYLGSNSRNYAHIIFSKDWHITPGDHFLKWPEHCVAGTSGADFFWTVQEWFDSNYALGVEYAVPTSIVYKGQRSDGYTAWCGNTESYRYTPDIIERNAAYGAQVTIDVCGLVTEHCVKATVLSALSAGYPVNLLENLITANNPRNGVKALDEMVEAGATLTGGL